MVPIDEEHFFKAMGGELRRHGTYELEPELTRMEQGDR